MICVLVTPSDMFATLVLALMIALSSVTVLLLMGEEPLSIRVRRYCRNEKNDVEYPVLVRQ